MSRRARLAWSLRVAGHRLGILCPARVPLGPGSRCLFALGSDVPKDLQLAGSQDGTGDLVITGSGSEKLLQVVFGQAGGGESVYPLQDGLAALVGAGVGNQFDERRNESSVRDIAQPGGELSEVHLTGSETNRFAEPGT